MTSRAAALVITAACLSACSSLGCKREPEPTGPTLESVAPDEGVLTLKFPNPPPGARVQVYGRGLDVKPETFPVRIAVPLGQQLTVMAWASLEGSFETTVTVAKYTGRRGEVVIKFPDTRSATRFGLYRSDLPTEVGYVPLTPPQPGEPAALVFEVHAAAGSHADDRQWFLTVDDRGAVWKSTTDRYSPARSHVRLGSLEPAVLNRMRSLSPRSILGDVVKLPDCGSCFDCGGSAVWVYNQNPTERHGVVIAGVGDGCALRNTPEAKAITGWLVALRNQAWPQMPVR